MSAVWIIKYLPRHSPVSHRLTALIEKRNVHFNTPVLFITPFDIIFEKVFFPRVMGSFPFSLGVFPPLWLFVPPWFFPSVCNHCAALMCASKLSSVLLVICLCICSDKFCPSLPGFGSRVFSCPVLDLLACLMGLLVLTLPVPDWLNWTSWTFGVYLRHDFESAFTSEPSTDLIQLSFWGLECCAIFSNPGQSWVTISKPWNSWSYNIQM